MFYTNDVLKSGWTKFVRKYKLVLNEKLSKNGNYLGEIAWVQRFNLQYSTMINSAQIKRLLKYHVNFQSDSGHQDIVKINVSSETTL